MKNYGKILKLKLLQILLSVLFSGVQTRKRIFNGSIMPFWGGEAECLELCAPQYNTKMITKN